jgi:hypothetical protein
LRARAAAAVDLIANRDRLFVIDRVECRLHELVAHDVDDIEAADDEREAIGERHDLIDRTGQAGEWIERDRAGHRIDLEPQYAVAEAGVNRVYQAVCQPCSYP